jgi:hypothetical protein
MTRVRPIAKMKRRGFATIARPILAILAPLLVCAPTAPAIYINVDWSGRVPFGWSLAAVAGIAMAAVFMESARKVREWYWKPLPFCLALFGMCINMAVAMKTASVASDDDRNARQTRILAANRASSQSSQSSQRRDGLAAIAGETPSATYEAQIQEAINQTPWKWKATAQCTDVKGYAGAYCAEIASLQGKKKAAEEREKLDAQAPVPVVNAAPSEDPFADDIAASASAAGYAVDKKIVTPLFNGGRALWLEVMAAFGPAGVRFLLERVPQGPQAPLPEPVETSSDPEIEDEKEDVRDERQRWHDIFVAECLEMYSGAVMPTAEPWKIWQAFCAIRGVPPGIQREFTQRLRKNFPHDPHNGRPRFLNVRAKQKTPALRLAVSN